MPIDQFGREAVVAAEALWQAIAQDVPAHAGHGRFRETPVNHLTHVLRGFPSSGVSEAVRWCREIRAAKESRQDAIRDFAIDKLPAIARRAIAVLDKEAVAHARREFDRRAERLRAEPLEDAAPAKPIPVFVSYRVTHTDLAKRVHALFDQLGEGAYFDSFLAAHDTIASADLIESYLDEIRHRPVFVPVCSIDYAEEGKVSERELKLALELEGEGGHVVAPILPDGEAPSAWTGWSRPFYFVVPASGELDDKASAAFEQFAVAVFRAVRETKHSARPD